MACGSKPLGWFFIIISGSELLFTSEGSSRQTNGSSFSSLHLYIKPAWPLNQTSMIKQVMHVQEWLGSRWSQKKTHMPTSQKAHLNYQTASYLEPARGISSVSHGLNRQGHDKPQKLTTHNVWPMQYSFYYYLQAKAFYIPIPYTISHVVWHEFE